MRVSNVFDLSCWPKKQQKEPSIPTCLAKPAQIIGANERQITGTASALQSTRYQMV